MLSPFAYAILSVIIISLISLVGLFALSVRKGFLEKALATLVSLAAGTLLGVAFLDLLPESIDKLGESTFFITLLGIIVFFIIENVLHWHHHHYGHDKRKKHIHPVGYLNLVGGGVHNLLDGVIIAAAYIVSIPLGIATTIAVILHEIPQEIGDFAILVHSGFSRIRALMFNFASALTAIAGAIIAFYFAGLGENLAVLIPFAAGGFIYIALADLLPEIHKHEKSEWEILAKLFVFFIGVGIIWYLGLVLQH